MFGRNADGVAKLEFEFGGVSPDLMRLGFGAARELDDVESTRGRRREEGGEE